MGKELLLVVESVANEKEMPSSVIFEALEHALVVVTRRSHQNDQMDVRVSIDQETGDYTTFRRWLILDDDEELINPSREMRLSVAREEFPDADLKIGEVYEIKIENDEFGRISAQQAKQVIIQKMREIEREQIYNQFIDQEGTLVSGTVKRMERGNVVIDIGGVETVMTRDELIPRETIRPGDRLRAYLEKVNKDLKGPLLQLSRVAPEFMIELFKLEVHEIGSGLVDIVNVARIPGLRAKIAVRSNDPRIDPVGTCIGIKTARVQTVMNEMAGEKIDIIQWDDDIETYLRHAMAPFEIKSVSVHEKNHTLDVSVSDDLIAKVVGSGGQNVRLVSELLGWSINVLSEKEVAAKKEERKAAQKKEMAAALGLDETVVDCLFAHGLTSVDALAACDQEELSAIKELDQDVINKILEKISDYLLTQIFEPQDLVVTPEDEMAVALNDWAEIDKTTAEALINQGIETREDLAELAVDELIEMLGMEEAKASALIMQAREPWFRNEREG